MISLLFKILLLYFLAAIILGMIPVNRYFRQSHPGIDIFVASNGVHTDLILPVHNGVINWQDFFPDADFYGQWQRARYIAFGWGDRGFYLNTPEWKDLTAGTAFRALFIPSESAMHVTLWPAPKESRLAHKLSVSRHQYEMIVECIKKSFDKSDSGKAIRIDHPGYSRSDLFFRSGYRFHLFRTCNVWTNTCLRNAGIRSGIWAPLDKTIMLQLRANQ